jgi:pimeloyl-ACP methyl ester carboxylesterase
MQMSDVGMRTDERKATSGGRRFVIVHGGWGGGWEWTPVAHWLRERGYEVFTPTLAGLSERGHLGPEVGLSAHVEEIAGLLEFEGLHDVVLCGASYGGMVITGAADLVPERIGLLVYIDAFVPEDGQSTLDFMPEDFAEMLQAVTDERGHGWFPIPEEFLPPRGLIPDEERERYVSRLRDHPAASCSEPVRITGEVDRLHRAFIRCTGGEADSGDDPFDAMASRARSEGWPYRELALPHDPHLFDPARTAAVLSELASIGSRDAQLSSSA